MDNNKTTPLPTVDGDGVLHWFRSWTSSAVERDAIASATIARLERELSEAKYEKDEIIRASRTTCDGWRRVHRQLKQELNEAERDIESYRGALGYSIAGTHDGKLTDGTTPQCGMCNSEYRKSIEAERDQLRKVCDELASTIYVHSLRPQNALDGYNQLPHVQERKAK